MARRVLQYIDMHFASGTKHTKAELPTRLHTTA